MGVSAIGASIGPNVDSYYQVTAYREALAEKSKAVQGDRVPSVSYSSKASLEGHVMPTDVDEYGELTANVPAMEIVNVSKKYVRESRDNSDIYNEVRKESEKSRILSYGFNADLFPTIVSSMWGSDNLLNNLFGNRDSSGLLDILNSIGELNQNLVDFQSSMDHGRRSEFDYSGYLEKNSGRLRELADYIVGEYGAMTQDERAYAVMDWVQKNLEYTSDMDHHGTGEYWSRPTETLRNLLGDCEDGAFLSAGLALHAGIEEDRVRFYGGLVRAGTNAETGGHGWWSYKREKDDEWVVLDWCYLPNQKAINDRRPMREDKNYLTDWFVVMGNGLTIDTGAVNSVRDPDALDRWDGWNVSNNGYNLALGEFQTRGQELFAAYDYLKQNGGISSLAMENNEIVLYLMEMQKSVRNEGVLELQKGVADKFSEFVTS